MYSSEPALPAMPAETMLEGDPAGATSEAAAAEELFMAAAVQPVIRPRARVSARGANKVVFFMGIFLSSGCAGPGGGRELRSGLCALRFRLL